ncbi:MAG: Tyrosine recombinase XerC [Candidatus Gottesmanbacteria bacterium GW2011_GWB1_49_7]|uniref:Tyrosine recombinase XerC n=1 Tax=Candidatus Gottesmanbacteria bacterium GW2011_GWB1_49_7 TaxID=1618448 RepID=A0A0G1W2W3_9BACT|nr:MAG: Tyrosine recombinase XerC [Candidatus Gottesmanbacteria bacterium GW2011_GWB1_49_7]
MSLDLKSAHTQFTEYLTSRRRARATIVAYGKDIEQVTTFLTNMGKKTISEVTRDELEAFLKKLAADKYTPKSISRKINSIKTFFRFLKAASIITMDPAIEIAHPKYEVKPPRILSKIEYRALRDACRGDIRMYAIVELFLQTGIRIGELAALTVGDAGDSELHIATQEGHAERSVPLNKAGKEALDRYLSVRNGKAESKALFITKTGRPLLIRNIRTAIDRYFRIAGIEGAKVNDLRHTFIAHHLMAGTSITTLSKLVGHKRLSTTERYLELVKDKATDTVKLEEL